MSPPPASVVLLHGLGRSKWSMSLLGLALARNGYRVLNLGYPSRRRSIEEHSRWLAETLGAQRLGAPTHFVTHSLGGILVRHFLGSRPFPSLGRVVMLSPPNQGSELAEKLRPNPLFQAITGPAGQQLGTAGESVPNQLGPVDFELGVITGDRSFNPLFSQVFDGPNDGKVAVERARVEGMKDFLVLPGSHTFLMNRSDVMAEVVHFLRQGRFSKTSSPEERPAAISL